MMSSKSRTISPGKRLAIAACLATAGLGLAACGDDSKSNTGPGYNEVHAPTVSVQGTVVDNNGNVIPGVTVTTGGQSTKTDASGTYNFAKVVASNTNTGDGSDTEQSITLTLQPPAGYLGATITVTPQAQVVAGGSPAVVVNPQVVFVDGYAVSAGTARLPAINAVISGTLRDRDTQAPLAGVQLYAQFQKVESANLGGAPGVNVTYATGSNTAVSGGQTAADGVFSFPALAADSCYSIYAVGYNVTDAGDVDFDVCGGSPHSGLANIVISTDNAPIQLNQVFAFKSPNADSIHPYVSKLDHVLDQAKPTGQLDSSVSNVLVVNFSERVSYAANAANPVTVIAGNGYNNSNQQISSIALDSTGTVMTITLANALPANADVLVNLPTESIKDGAGNLLIANAAEPVGFDSLVSLGGTSNNSEYVQLTLKTFKPAGGSTGAVTLSQNFGPDAVSAVDPVFSKLFASSNALVNIAGDLSAFNDATDSGNGAVSAAAAIDPTRFSQFNAWQTSPHVYAQLSNLASAFNGGAVNDSLTNVARVTVTLATPLNVADVALQVTDAAGNPKDVLIFPKKPAFSETNVPGLPLPKVAAPNNSTAETPNIGDGSGWYGIDPKGASTFDVLIVSNTGDSLLPGDLLHVVARSASGGTHLVDNGAVLTLKDGVGPTAALQILGATQGNSASSAVGQGGVIFVGGGAGGPSTVILPVTPQLGNTSDASEGALGGIYAGNSFVQELYNPSGLKAAGAANAAGVDSFLNKRADTDATGVKAYLTSNASAAGSLKVSAAIAVTEKVTSAASLVVPYTGTAVLSGFGAIPNVVSKISGPVAAQVPGVFNDLVTLSVDNVFTLAADGRADKVIDLTGTITDANGNVAAAGDNARVIVQDLFPPVMTAAYTDGKNYTFKFNEPVQLYGAIDLAQCGVTLDLRALATAATPKATLDATKTVVTVSQSAVTGNCFFPTTDATHTYAEAAYTTANTGVATIPAKLQHGFVSFNTVPDSVGNTWDTGTGTPAPNQATVTPWAVRELGMGSPRFAMVNLVGPLGVSANINGFTTGSNAFTASLTANQPLINLLSATTAAPAGANPSMPGGDLAVYTTGVTVTAGIGAFPCAGAANYGTPACKTFIDHSLVITGACAVPANTSTATISADNTTVSYSINCPAAIGAGDTATVASDNNKFVSGVIDPNTGNNGVFTLGASPANLYQATAN